LQHLARASESNASIVAWTILAAILNLVGPPLGISPIAALSIAALETGWNDAARVLLGTRNFWNVRGAYGRQSYDAARALLPALDRLGAPPANLTSPSGQFRAYRDPIEAVGDLARLARVERYATQRVTDLSQTPDAIVRAWQRGGFNPNEDWAPRVISIMRRLQGILPG